MKTDRNILQQTKLPPALCNLSHVFIKHNKGLIMLACNGHLIVISRSFKLKEMFFFLSAN